ncbi:MAG: segregation/condensation protein A [Lachnospiraceae bacterium]|nr:segregation/condensation protein A [Lachnospiraceae bacterium]
MTQPTYKLDNLNFDGPLDLLLQLLEKNKVDIYDIPIAEITAQYFSYIRRMEETDLDVVSDFLVMAATLLDIKARMLLPSEDKTEEEEEDPREELVRRLLEYKRYKYIAHELDFYEEYAERFVFKEGELPEELRTYVPPVDLDELLHGVSMDLLKEVYDRILKHMQAGKNTEQENFGTIRRERISLARCIRTMVNYARSHRRFSFRQMLAGGADRTEVVVSFLAVLELMRMGKITVWQETQDQDLDVEVREGADLEDVDLSELVDA